MVVSELVTKFSFVGNINLLKDYNKEIGAAIPKTKRLGIVGLGVGAALGKMITGSLSSNNDWAQLAYRTGESIEQLERWHGVALATGATSEQFKSSILSMSKAIAAASLDGSLIFNKMGINIRDDRTGENKLPTQVLNDALMRYNQHLQGRRILSEQQIMHMSEQWGLSYEMMGMYKMTSAELENMFRTQSKISGLSTLQLENIRRYNNSAASLGNSITKIYSRIMADFAPFFTRMMDSTQDFLQKYDGIVSAAGAAAMKIGLWASGIAIVSSILYKIWGVIKWIGKWVRLVAVFFGWWGVAIAGIVLVVEDLFKAFTGGESVFKDMYDYAIKIGEAIQGWFTGTIDKILTVEEQMSAKLNAGVVVTAQAIAAPFARRGDGASPFNRPINPSTLLGTGSGAATVAPAQSTINQSNTITIHTDRPEEMREVIDNNLNQIRDAQLMFNVGSV